MTKASKRRQQRRRRNDSFLITHKRILGDDMTQTSERRQQRRRRNDSFLITQKRRLGDDMFLDQALLRRTMKEALMHTPSPHLWCPES